MTSDLIWPAPAHVVAETLDGGQCFRWNCETDGTWRGVSGTCAAEVASTLAEAHARVVAGTLEALGWHLADDVDWRTLADQLPWRTDAHLARCIAAFPGLRILRQPIGEALLCFLCSATKQIVQIKQMAELLAARFGRPLPLSAPHALALAPPPPSRRHDRPAAARNRSLDARAGPAAAAAQADPGNCHPLVDNTGGAAAGDCHPIVDNGPEAQSSRERARSAAARSTVPGRAWRGLPTWAELAAVPEAELRACKLGFRARHVHAVARRLADTPGWLDETAALPYAEAKVRLMTLPGVGEKIADCVLLFGAARLEAFPVDVWILRALAKRYGLTGWQPSQVAQFGRVHFGRLAGLAQQFLFAWERRHGRESSH